jgi:hypothetical protein
MGIQSTYAAFALATFEKGLLQNTASFDPIRIEKLIIAIFGITVHLASLKSLSNAVIGLLRSGTLRIHSMGRGYSAVSGIKMKSAIAQIDRFVGNTGIKLETFQRCITNFITRGQMDIMFMMDWTEFDEDDHTTLVMSVATDHGRSIPVAWRSYKKSKIKGKMGQYEEAMIETLHSWFDPAVKLTLAADRGFGKQTLYQFLQALGWDFVIRFRGDITVKNENGEKKRAKDWLEASETMVKLDNVRVTADECELPAVVIAKEKGMKDTWCLATTLASHGASKPVKLYGRRFTIEETFRDNKDLRFGLGLSATHIGDASRRDRLLLVAVVAQIVLTLLGAASERIGMDREFKANTSKRRTHSLFKQGLFITDAIQAMSVHRSAPLLAAFAAVIREHLRGCATMQALCACSPTAPDTG